MSVIASDGNPYPALCPWFHVVTLVRLNKSRITVEHEGVSESFEVDDLARNFACVFNRALKIKHAMVTAAKVAEALSNG